MDATRRQHIISALEAKRVNMPCPRCGTRSFDLVAESTIQIQERPGTFVVGGPAIPVVVVACSNCGFITEHAIGPLGLMAEAR